MNLKVDFASCCRAAAVFLMVVMAAKCLNAAPPASRRHLLFLQMIQKITVPEKIAGPTGFREDTRQEFFGEGVRYIRAAPYTQWVLWYDWGDGNTTPVKTAAQKVNHTYVDSGLYTIKLFLQYTRRISGGFGTNPVDVPGHIEEIARKTVLVTAHEVEDGNSIYFALFSETGSEINEGQIATFSAHAIIDYAKAVPEPYDGPDFFSGVRAGSVAYKWRIVRPCGFVEFEDEEWQEILATGSKVIPLAYRFDTPLFPHKYEVELLVRYREHRWKPLYSNGAIIGWEYDPEYEQNNMDKWCQKVALNKPAKYTDKNLLKSGYTSFTLMVNDTTPAVAIIESGPATGTTGDPLPDYKVVVRVSDNNPYAEFRLPVLIEELYKERSGSVTSDNQNTSFVVPGEITRSVGPHSRFTIDPLTGERFSGSMARYEFEFGRSLDYKTRLPDDYALTMPEYGPSDINRPLSYYALITVADGHRPYEGHHDYRVKSDVRKLEVTDNDAPEIYVRLHTRPPVHYRISKGVRDRPGNPARIDIDLNGSVYTAADDPFKMEPSEPLQIISAEFCPTVHAGERIRYEISGNDNVNGEITDGILTSDEPLFTSGNSFFSFERVPEQNPVQMLCYVVDGAGNKREIAFLMHVKELGFAPRIIETRMEAGK